MGQCSVSYILMFIVTMCDSTTSSSLPTLYEYYTSDGIKSGLTDNQTFKLNEKPIQIFSGALHYFRVPSDYWKDRLRKLRASGLNTVETYVPWNLLEPSSGDFNFTPDIVSFIKIAQEEDLFVIVRPGPYICAEWEFGGLPSWLLSYNLKVRTSDLKFLEFTERYFKQLFKILVPLQFQNGGPIIAFQIENEYGNTKNDDLKYLISLKNIFENNGIRELLFTSDTPSNGFSGTIPGVLATANFQDNPKEELKLLQEFQPNKPLMVMEFWSGWFDHWAESHHVRTVKEFGDVLNEILKLNSSFNLYMFHGGTSWGFWNGANLDKNSVLQPTISSYDYIAPLSESGEYTDKYFKLKELIEKYSIMKFKVPPAPEVVPKIAYESIKITTMLTYNQLIEQTSTIQNSEIKSMEFIGQSYGYIIYRQKNLTIVPNSILKIEGKISDSIQVFINSEMKSKIISSKTDLLTKYWRQENSTINLGSTECSNATLDLIVTNWGRANFGTLDQFNQFKGILGNVLLNNQVLQNWEIVPLEFKQEWIEKLQGWTKFDDFTGPALYKAILTVTELKDTFVDLRNWNTGIVIVNNFVLSRYLRFGPQQTAYLPAPLLKIGENEILIFEQFKPGREIHFSGKPIVEVVDSF